VLDANALPNDLEGLKRLLLEREGTAAAQALKLREKDRLIEHLKLQLARFRRWRYGQSSEQLEGAGQIPLSLEAIEAAVREVLNASEAMPQELAAAAPAKSKPVRRAGLPEHFERTENLIAPPETCCPDCAGPLTLLGEPDVAEVAEVKTITFTVTRHVRPKKRCSKCSTIVQAPAPSRPIEKSFAGASLLALILTWKFAFHLPLHRQCQMFAHAGLRLSRTTLMQWVGGSTQLLAPLVEALGRYVLATSNVNTDDTPVRVLAPGTGKTKEGRLWTYVRDGTRWGSSDPPAVWYQYSANRKGEHPQRHLSKYVGKVQADAYAGYVPLFVAPGPGVPARMLEIACWAHVRRGLFDLFDATKSPTAKEALDRIGTLYDIEEDICGHTPDVRRAARQQRAVPHLKALHEWLVATRAKVENASALAKALDYALSRWVQLCRYAEDGRLEIDNNTAERSLRGVAIGRKNYLFFGADSGGERAAIAYSLIETCKLNKIDPQRYLHYVLERIADHPINRIEELLPWNVADKLDQPEQVTEALAA